MSALSKIAEMKPSDFNEMVQHNKKNNWPDLESKQKMFAVRYLETYSVSKAATEAGNASASWGSTQLRNPLVMEYISELQNVYAKRSFINKDFINVQMMQHLEVVKGEVSAPFCLSDGSQVEGKRYDASQVSKVLTELAKSTKFYEDGSSEKAAVTVNVNLAALGISEEVSVGAVIEGELNKGGRNG